MQMSVFDSNYELMLLNRWNFSHGTTINIMIGISHICSINSVVSIKCHIAPNSQWWPSPMPSLIPSQSYQMASQVISVPLPSCSYAMPINSSPVCGTFSGSVSVSGNQDYIPPTTQFQLPWINSVEYTTEKVWEIYFLLFLTFGYWYE